MKLDWMQDYCRDSLVYRLEFWMDEIRDISMDQFKHASIQLGESSEKISDKLLALHLIARKIEERHAEHKGNGKNNERKTGDSP